MSTTHPVIKQILHAIQAQDYQTLEGLRDQVRPEHLGEVVRHWRPDLPWAVKDGFVAVLMDQTGLIMRPLMEDALDSPTIENRAAALCVLTEDFDLFSRLLTPGGWVDRDRVAAAVADYRRSRG